MCQKPTSTTMLSFYYHFISFLIKSKFQTIKFIKTTIKNIMWKNTWHEYLSQFSLKLVDTTNSVCAPVREIKKPIFFHSLSWFTSCLFLPWCAQQWKNPHELNNSGTFWNCAPMENAPMRSARGEDLVYVKILAVYPPWLIDSK